MPFLSIPTAVFSERIANLPWIVSSPNLETISRTCQIIAGGAQHEGPAENSSPSQGFVLCSAVAVSLKLPTQRRACLHHGNCNNEYAFTTISYLTDSGALRVWGSVRAGCLSGPCNLEPCHRTPGAVYFNPPGPRYNGMSQSSVPVAAKRVSE
jgi:hypothetical protein